MSKQSQSQCPEGNVNNMAPHVQSMVWENSNTRMGSEKALLIS